jgi:HAD superfamily hydrolase (TIGR01509 family)
MIKLIIFDWDDVIIFGAKEGYYHCYKETLKELGIVLDEKEIDKRIENTWGSIDRILRELLKENLNLMEKASKVFYEKEFYGNAFVDSLQEMQGVNELLIRLKEKYKLAVASGNKPDMIKDKIMPKFHIPNVFDQIVSVGDVSVGKSKPDPYMLQLILKTQGVSNRQTLFVGDAKSDVLMAKNAGIEPVVVLTGLLSKAQAEALGVKHILSDVTKIEEILS